MIALVLAAVFTLAAQESKNVLKNPDFKPSYNDSGIRYFTHWVIPKHGGMTSISVEKGWKGKNALKLESNDTTGPETQMMVLQHLGKDSYVPGKYFFSVNAKLSNKVRRLCVILGVKDLKTNKMIYADRSYFANEQGNPGEWKTYVWTVTLPDNSDNGKSVTLDFRTWNAKAATVWFDSPKLVKIEEE